MEITVEVGTKQQKELIHQELSIIKSIADALTPPPAITKIVVPANFDKAANLLQNTNHYKSERGNLAVAKNIPQDNGVALVFSPLLYTDEHDNHTRMQIYTHEFFHVVSKTMFPQIPKNSQSDFIYFNNIYTLFDEYYANRKSYKVTEEIYQEMSHRYRKNNASNLKCFIESIVGNCDYYRKLRTEIFKFRFHANVDTFLKNTDNSFDAAAKSIVYIYSYFDHNLKTKRLESLLEKSHFFNGQTKSLMEYFRKKYEDNDFDLFGARDLIEAFMMKFGIKFEDMENGQLYCHVLNI